MALGFTSHYSQSEQPFGSLILSNTENETTGSVAYSPNNNSSLPSLLSQNTGDSYVFSVSVNIDYSQYANFVAASGSTETAGSVAYSGGSVGFSDCSSGGASFSGGSVSCSSGGSSGGGGCSASFTC